MGFRNSKIIKSVSFKQEIAINKIINLKFQEQWCFVCLSMINAITFKSINI
jgi:hypothetical protein